MGKSVLILGANGRFGRHAAEAFWNAGWRVRTFDRSKDELMLAAKGVDVVVNGWNPPSYEDWAKQLLPLNLLVIEAAKASGATILVPSNLYVYGHAPDGVLSADTAHTATNPLAKLKIEAEDAYCASGVRVILLRAGDFLDTEASDSWFDRIIAKDAHKGRLSYPGDLDAQHAWAWLPDLGRAAVELAEMRSELSAFEDVLFPGYDVSARELGQIASRVTGREFRVSRMSWIPVQVARPFWALAKHLLEMRYLWSMPHQIDATKFDTLLPNFVHTPPEDALALALKHKIHPDKLMARQGAAIAAE